ncbi:MAG TPA: hypothetical protein VE988_03380, partial [Gemmataceae bacterium]|nr:hypothetical protein [Gemmataceae bacterium]
FSLDGATWESQWLAARTPGLDVQAAVGLSPVKDVAAEPGLPTGVADRLGQRARVWKVVTSDWKLSLIAKTPTAQAGLDVLLAEQEVAFGAGFGWIHQATILVHVTDSSEMAIDMPAGARLLAATVNGEQISARPVGVDRLAVILPPGERLHRLRLRWTFGPETAPLTQPLLIAPRLEGMQALVFNWTLTLPPGFRLAQGGAGLEQTPLLELARHELARAEARKTATQLLIEQFQKSPEESLKMQIQQSQQFFARHCKLANAAVAGAVVPYPALHLYQSSPLAQETAETWEAGCGELKAQLAELERQNTAMIKTAGIDKWRVQEDKSGAGTDLEEHGDLLLGQGTIVRWRGSAQAQLPGAGLIPLQTDIRNRAWAGTAWIVLACLVLFALSFSLPALGWLQRLWPEQIAALALLGWTAWGFSLLAGVLLLLAVTIRSAQAVEQLRRWHQARQPEPTSNTLANTT